VGVLPDEVVGVLQDEVVAIYGRGGPDGSTGHTTSPCPLRTVIATCTTPTFASSPSPLVSLKEGRLWHSGDYTAVRHLLRPRPPAVPARGGALVGREADALVDAVGSLGRRLLIERESAFLCPPFG
jgi:hypothetical protein